MSSGIAQLKGDIINSIKKHGNFWLFFKGGYPGMASNIDFMTKKIYTEFVILPSGHPDAPCTMRAYGKTDDINFEKLKRLIEARYDSTNDYINPDIIIESVKEIQEEYTIKAKDIIERERFEIIRRYESEPVEKNPYIRRIFLHFKGKFEKFAINFQYYPGCPFLLDQDRLCQKLKIKDVNDLETIREWNEREPSHVFDIIDEIGEKLFSREAQAVAKEQVMAVHDLVLKGTDTSIDFQVPRGITLGFFMEGDGASATFTQFSDHLVGKTEGPTRCFEIFGKPPGKERAGATVDIIENKIAGVSLESRVKPLLKRTLRVRKLGFQRRRRVLKAILETLVLKPIKRTKLLGLSSAEKIRVNIALSLARGTRILVVNLQEFNINRLEYGQVEKMLRAISRKFHAIVIVAGPVEILSRLDQIITISASLQQTTTGSVEDYREMLPGDVVILQVKDVAMDFKKYLERKTGSLVVEEVLSERFKIFAKGDPDPLIVDLCKDLDEKIYKIIRKVPSVDDYLEYTRLTGFDQLVGQLNREEGS